MAGQRFRVLCHAAWMLSVLWCVETPVCQAAPSPTNPPDPAAVAAATVVADGFTMELAAAEPAVVDPVAITFDERGTPYVAEYRDYPLGPPEGAAPLSRIVRLDDADGDGFYERSNVFADGLPFVQGVLAVRGGLLVTSAPDLLLLTDTDGDGRADRREVVATGFAVKNPQLRAACPQLDIDNSISLTGGLSGGSVARPGHPESEAVSIDRHDVRIDFASGEIRAATGFGQFGNAFDELGRRFTTSNRNPLIAVRLPLEALRRNPFVDLGSGYEDAAPSGAASQVFPIGESYTTALSHAGTHTSACGMTIFTGDLLGDDAVGDAFICEPVSFLVTRRQVLPQGAGFASERVGPQGKEFIASRSEWFKPVFTVTGPDGALWVADMCRQTVEHPQYMPAGLAETIDLRAGDTAGRLWRIKRADIAPRPWSPPASATAAAALLADPNGWRRTTAKRLLVERRFPDAAPAVRAFLQQHPGPLATVGALWTLHGLGALEDADIRSAVGSPDAGVRETAARLADRMADESLIIDAATRLIDDDDPHVRLAATLAVANLDGSAATDLLVRAVSRRPIDAWIARAILSGAVTRAAPLLAAIAAVDRGSTADPAVIEVVERLGATAVGELADGAREALSADARAAVAFLAERATNGLTDWFDVAALSGLSSRLPLTALAATAPQACERAVRRAETLAAEPTSPTATRMSAIRLLGAAAKATGSPLATPGLKALQAVAGSGGAPEPRAAAVATLVRSGDEAALGDSVTAIVEGAYEPSLRELAVRAILDDARGTSLLLSAIEAGTCPASVVPLDRRAGLSRSPDRNVREKAARIWESGGAVGLSADEVAAIVATVRTGGRKDRGRQVFVTHCAGCHQMDDVGHAVGPALAQAADRPIEQMVTAIIDPNHSVEPRWESTVILTNDGKVVEGLVAESNEQFIVLVRAGGERCMVSRADIDAVRATGRSLMPEGFGRAIKPEEFADLIAFIRRGRPVPALEKQSLAKPAGVPVAASADSREAGLRAGAAMVDISPTKFPVPVNGGMRQALATGIHDPMHARCLVIHDGRHPIVIVEVDACMIPREMVDDTKRIAREKTGIPPERIIIAATHTHSAAALAPAFQCEVDTDYAATVAPRIAKSIEQAVAHLEPAEWGWAFAAAPEHVFNRRWFMKPGATYENPFGGMDDRVKMNPGHVQPSVSVPSGPVDQDVAVMAVRSRADKRPLGLVANYSLHYVGGLPAISADYFAAFADEMTRRLEAADGRYAGKPPFVAMLSNGTSGNVNNVDFASPPVANAPRDLRIRAVASGVADAAERAYAAISWRSEAAIDSAARELSLGVRKGTAAELARARAWMESIPKDRDGQWSDIKAVYARETVKLADYPDHIRVPLQVHRLDDVSIATIPCEVFVETGLQLKKTSPFVRHFTVSLANGYNGYLPRPIDHQWGGYETWRARSSYLEVDAEPQIVAALEAMASELHARRREDRGGR